MAAISTHEDPFVVACTSHCSQMSRHVTWGIDEEKGCVVEKVVCAVERSKGSPTIGLKAEFFIARMFYDRAQAWRARISRPTRTGRRFTSGTGNHICVWEFGAVAHMIKMKMTEDYSPNGGRMHRSFLENINGVLRSDRLDDVRSFFPNHLGDVLQVLPSVNDKKRVEGGKAKLFSSRDRRVCIFQRDAV